MKGLIMSAVLGASLLAAADGQAAAGNNPFGLVYENAIKENVPGKVNIHPLTYKLHGLEIAANVYTQANYDKAKKYPAIVVAHPNGGTKEQVAGLFAQRMVENGYITIAADAALSDNIPAKQLETAQAYFYRIKTQRPTKTPSRAVTADMLNIPNRVGKKIFLNSEEMFSVPKSITSPFMFVYRCLRTILKKGQKNTGQNNWFYPVILSSFYALR